MKKKLIVCLITLSLLTGCGKVPKLSNGEETILKFKDGTMYSVDDIWREFKDKYALTILMDKVDLKILNEEYKDNSDKMKELDDRIKSYEATLKSNYVNADGAFDQVAFNQALASAGFDSIDPLLDQQKLTILTEFAVIDYAKNQITEKQVKDYYKDEAVGDIHCVHVLVKPAKSDTTSDNEAKEKAENIIKAIQEDIKNGTSAEEAFKKYESDSSVTYQDLDYFNKDDMVEAFSNAAFALKKGEYSKSPVKTTYGYHVILKLDEKEKDTLENLTDSIKEKLGNKLIEDDETMEIKALVELRKKHEIAFEDDKLKEQYNRYVNNMLNK